MVVRVLALLALMVTALPALAQEDMTRALDCQDRLKKLNEAGVVRDLAVEPGSLRLVVHKTHWSEASFEQKTRMAELVACMATKGDKKKTARVTVYDHLNNQVVGRYNGIKLEVP